MTNLIDTHLGGRSFAIFDSGNIFVEKNDELHLAYFIVDINIIIFVIALCVKILIWLGFYSDKLTEWASSRSCLPEHQQHKLKNGHQINFKGRIIANQTWKI